MAHSPKARRARAPKAESDAPLGPPPMPPKSAEELRDSDELFRGLQEASRLLRARNLSNAVLLAQQAACGRGDLVEHFAELGRRFGHLLRAPEKPPALRVVKGGKS